MDANSASFVAALDTARLPNYLGDAAVVDRILRVLAQTALNRRATLTAEEADKANADDCNRLADVFLGLDSDCTSMPFNSAGQIDLFVRQEMGWPSGEAQEVMRHFFAEFIGDFERLADYASERDVPESNWNWQPAAIVETYVQILLGIRRVED